MQRLRRDVDNAPAFRIAPRHLRVLHAQEDEDEERHQDEERGALPEVPVEDPGHVVDGRADVGEDDGPAQEHAQVPAPDLDPARRARLEFGHSQSTAPRM